MIIDLSTLDLPAQLRHRARPRTLAERRALMTTTVHVTDPGGRGGFSVAKYQISAAVRLQLRRPELQSWNPSELALAIRLAGLPYHHLGSPHLGALRLHPVALRTSHGDRGNFGGGWAIDCEPDEPLTPSLRAAGTESLTGHVLSCIDARHAAGGDMSKPHVVIPHRVWSGDRTADPGAITWRGVVLPAVEHLRAVETRCEVVIGYRTRYGSGLPIPRSWDDAALFDEHGSPLA